LESLSRKFWKVWVGNFWKSESEILESWSRKFWKGRSRIFYLWLHNPDLQECKATTAINKNCVLMECCFF